MGSYTSKLNLYMPDIGETGWGALVNSNFSKIDSHSHTYSEITGSISASKLPLATKTTVGAVKVGTGLNVDSNGVISTYVSQEPIYTVRIYQNASSSSVEVYCNDSTIDVSDSSTGNYWDKRLAIMQTFSRHCLIMPAMTSIRYVKETNYLQDVDGNTVSLDGTYGDFCLEIDTIWWTTRVYSGYFDIMFSTYKFASDCVTAHTYNSKVRKHLYHAVFPASYNSDKTAVCSVAKNGSSAVPFAASNSSGTKNVEQFYQLCVARGSGATENTYHEINYPEQMLLLLLELFVYKTKNIQANVAHGLNHGGAESELASIVGTISSSALYGELNVTGGWTQGYKTSVNTTKHCMVIGLWDFYGAQWHYNDQTIYDGATGTLYIGTDAYDHVAVPSTTFSQAITHSSWVAIDNCIYASSSTSGYIKTLSGNKYAFGFP